MAIAPGGRTAEGLELRSIADRVEIAPDVFMPRLGMGTWRSHGAEAYNAMRAALDLGYRLFDTSANYGNERDVGAALASSGVPRQDVFVTTKLEGPDQGFGTTQRALEASLKRLGMDYVDLYLIHWPNPAKTIDTWRGLEELVRSGLTRSIGVSNFDESDLEQVYSVAEVPPAVNQFEFHPLRQSPSLQDYCRRRSITMEAWAPVIEGRAGMVPELRQVGEAHGKTPSQISLRWILQKGVVAIPKSVHKARLRENADIFDFELSRDEVALIDSLEPGGYLMF